MRQLHLLVASLAGLVLCAGSLLGDTTRAAASPLRLMPTEVDLLVQVPDPARLVRSVEKQPILEQMLGLAAVKEQLGSTSTRRFRQLVAYAEKSLGAKWPELLERLAGGGMALGLKFASTDAPLLLVVQGRDEKLTEKFLALAIEVVQSELARQEARYKVEEGNHHGIPAFKIGNVYLARIGATLLLANRKEAMARALNLHLGKKEPSLVDHPPIVEAGQLLPKNPLVTGWVNMRPVQQSQTGKDLYRSPRDNSQLTVLVGGYLDVLGRTPYVCAALAEQDTGYLVSVRAPRGRAGMGPDGDLHLPPRGQPGSRPLLEPKHVLYSSSYYLDVARIWSDREKLFPKVQADAMTGFDRNSGRVLGGVKLSTLLETAGPYQRIVVVNQSQHPYVTKPKTRFPAFALVTEMRQPERFGRSMGTLLRTGALLATNQFKLELCEEKHAGHEIAGYRFSEKAALKDDVNDVRFNFSPCFVQVGNQFVFCSTIELCRELIDLLIAEQKAPGKSHASSGRDRYHAKGFASLLVDLEDTLITQTILDQAVPPAEAKKQVDEAIKLVRGLGTLTTEVRYEAKQFRYDFHVQIRK